MIIKSFSLTVSDDTTNWSDDTPQQPMAYLTMCVGQGAIGVDIPLSGPVVTITTEVDPTFISENGNFLVNSDGNFLVLPQSITETQINVRSVDLAAAMQEMAINLRI
jgi:hypothetical protein